LRAAFAEARAPLEARIVALEDALRGIANIGCIRMHWGARRPCREYGDREPCPPCSVAALLPRSEGRTPAQEAALDAIRAYGDARADVAYGRATRKAIDLAWEALLAALAVPPLATPPAPPLDVEREAARDAVIEAARDARDRDPAGFGHEHAVLDAALAALDRLERGE
jgi:hypothetical protein